MLKPQSAHEPETLVGTSCPAVPGGLTVESLRGADSDVRILLMVELDTMPSSSSSFSTHPLNMLLPVLCIPTNGHTSLSAQRYCSIDTCIFLWICIVKPLEMHLNSRASHGPFLHVCRYQCITRAGTSRHFTFARPTSMGSSLGPLTRKWKVLTLKDKCVILDEAHCMIKGTDHCAEVHYQGLWQSPKFRTKSGLSLMTGRVLV